MRDVFMLLPPLGLALFGFTFLLPSFTMNGFKTYSGQSGKMASRVGRA